MLLDSLVATALVVVFVLSPTVALLILLTLAVLKNGR